MNAFGMDIASTLGRSFQIPDWAKDWIVFILCLAATLIGVLISFVLFGSTLTGFQGWLAGPSISLVMMGISYGAKYANPQTKKIFTPLDLIQFFSQGLLWSSSWPTLATLFGIEIIQAPESTPLLETVRQILGPLF